MGIQIEIVPSFGLGLALHFEYAIFEIVFGPVLILIGDVDALASRNDEDEE
jgi:hypothetical protein